jgi:N6-L-threonylcarbamoyladenine synthase
VLLSEAVQSSSKDHAKTGGVIPTIAAQKHRDHLPLVIEQAFSGALATLSHIRKNQVHRHELFGEIDVVAVTQGPGLKSCLGTGIFGAKMVASAIRSECPFPLSQVADYAL